MTNRCQADPPALSVPLVGIDTGGTFTDFVVIDGAGVRIHKELSTPAAPEQAILAGLRALGLLGRPLRIVHGSTVATNAVLEGKGARTAFVTNRGFGDTLTIGRQARAALYDLTPVPKAPPVPPALCLETGGRLGADGSVVDPLTADDLAALVAVVREHAPEAVAVSLLFAFLDDRYERAIEAALAPWVPVVCRSSEVLPEPREYERGLATWLNAFVGPRMQHYLEALAAAVAPASLAVMQSSAQTCAPDFAARHGVHLLLSGPAAGLLGAKHVAALAGCERLLTFDMGGTSTDVALVEGDLLLSAEGAIGPYPVAVQMVDLHTIGAGGGSLAQVDAAGLLHVGPASAGASPGPACYGRGGVDATVTDAHVVLGRLPREVRLGGQIALNVAAAEAAVGRVAAALGLDLEAAAAGILAIADQHMAQALRVISVERGVDPRGHTLVSFGGAGGLHVCALAAALGMRQALVPAQAGVLSALGMTVARPGRQLVQAVRRPLATLSEADLVAGLAELEGRGRAALHAEGHAEADLAARPSVDVCYRGQSFALNLPWHGVDALATAFAEAHAQRYGHTLARPLDVVALRVAIEAAGALPVLAAGVSPANRSVTVTPGAAPGRYPVFAQEALPAGAPVRGPAVVVSSAGTAFIEAGWVGHADCAGNLLLALEC